MEKLKISLREFLSGFRGTNFELKVNGKILDAKLYDTDIREVLEKITQDKSAMLYHSNEIFRGARYLYSTPDYDGNPDVYRWNYFYTPVQIGDELVGVRIAVRDMLRSVAGEMDSQIYNWGIKKDISLSGGRQGLRPNTTGASSEMSLEAPLDGGGGGQGRISSGVSSDVLSGITLSQPGSGLKAQSLRETALPDAEPTEHPTREVPQSVAPEGEPIGLTVWQRLTLDEVRYAGHSIQQVGMALERMGPEAVRAVINQGLCSAPGMDSRVKAQVLRRKLDAGQDITPSELGHLYDTLCREPTQWGSPSGQAKEAN